MSEIKRRIWSQLRREVEEEVAHEPILASFFYATVLNHKTFEEALSFHLAAKLACPTLHAITLRDVMVAAHAEDPELAEAAASDLKTVLDRDPAARSIAAPFLFFKGFHALQTYRVAHRLWVQRRQSLALHLQSRCSELFAVDIHPAACIGRAILMDHATGVVIGETAVVEDEVTIFHEVTLGGTGKETGDRHPKVRRGVLLSAGAKVFGNIEIGEGAKVAGSSVVLEPVPPHVTVAGIPAKIVGKPRASQPAKTMDQRFEDGQARS